jgi:hypothetical protein
MPPLTDKERKILVLQEMKKREEKARSDFGAQCVNTLKDYTGKTKYKYINQFLLMDQNEAAFKKRFKKDMEEIKRDIQEMDDCFKKAPKTHDDKLILYRGMDRDLGMKPGESVQIKNYISTSLGRGAASDFMKSSTIDDKTKKITPQCCLFRLHIDKDIPFINMYNLSQFGTREAEVLLPRGLVMTYLDDEVKHDTYTYAYQKEKKYTWHIKNMKVTQLKPPELQPAAVMSAMADMGEPVTAEIDQAVEKQPAQPEKKGRCPKGTRKNKQGVCIPTSIQKFLEVGTPVAAAAAKETAETKKPAKPPTTRCPKGTRKNKEGKCVSVQSTAKTSPLPAKAPVPDLVPAQEIVQQIKTGQLKTKSLQGIVIEHENLYMTNGENTVLSDVDFTGASLTDVGLDGAELHGTHWTDAKLNDVVLEGSNMDNSVFKRAQLTDVTLNGDQMASAVFQDAQFTRVDINRMRPYPKNKAPDFTGAVFKEVTISVDKKHTDKVKKYFTETQLENIEWTM